MGERNSYSKTDHDATFMRVKEDPMMNGHAIRNVSVRVNRISSANIVQLSLFEGADAQQATDKLERAIDAIRSRYGYKAITRAYSKTEGGTAIDRAGLVGGHRG